LARNRMRYLVHEMGWIKFQQLVKKERSNVEMTISTSTAKSYDVISEDDSGLVPKMTKLPMIKNAVEFENSSYKRWAHTNVLPQRQDQYNVVFVTLGAGDITSNQLRGLAEIIRNFSEEQSARNTPNQNFAVRFVSTENLPKFYAGLSRIGLANPGALTIASAVGCSGTTSCNLAITNSHRLAKEVQLKLLQLGLDSDDSLRDSTIKISGCPNSCGQHEIATIGFYGGASRIGGSMAPTYTMLFGGSSGENGELGKTIMRIPAKRVIEVILKIIEIYKEEHDKSESLDCWIRRIVTGGGLGNIRNLDDLKSALSEVANLVSMVEDPDAYRDYGNDSKFVAKTARGECAA
jgi:sulfite reductase (ferredoxin)